MAQINKKKTVAPKAENSVKKTEAPKDTNKTVSKGVKKTAAAQTKKMVKKDMNIVKKVDDEKIKDIESSKTGIIKKQKNELVDGQVISKVPIVTKNASLKKDKKHKDGAFVVKFGKKEIEAERYKPSPDSGLTYNQVNERTQLGLVNKVKDKNTKTIGRILLNNIFTFFNMLCIIVATALIAVGKITDCFFMIIVVANTLIGIIQEIRAKKTIEKISLVNSPTCKVIREGVETEIPVDEVVLDDVLVFSTGRQISADCVILSGEVEVNESLLTGESVPIKKGVGEVLLSGSFIIGGKCRAQVDKVGNDSYSAKLADKAKEYKKPKSELMKSMKLIITVIGVIIIPLAILTFLNNYSGTEQNLAETVGSTASSIVGMIPSGMFLLTSMALAVGVVKLARKNTLVQDLYSIEMLARTDVLCLDKTGTITDGTMKVNAVIQLDNTFKHTISDLIGSMLTALDDNNQTSRALINHFGYSKEMTARAILPFNSTRKLSAVTFKNDETYVMGAPEFVLKTKNKEVENLVKQYAQKGFRVLLVASCEGIIEKDKISAKRTPICLIVIEDHIREDAVQTLEWFRHNGVDVKIISGDNPLTVSEVSRRVGVVGADKFISLEGLSEQQVIDAADKYTVFGRVSPEQKCILVKALKNKGHKVAMTGDGVNDILALKEADCSIAMASGSEATRHVSHLVLLDSNFSSMPEVVAEGRRVVNNVQNSSSLFLMKTIFTIILTIFCLVVGIKYTFSTTKLILLLELFVIGVPSFFLALQPNAEKIKGKFLPNLLAKSMPAALIFSIMVIATYLLNVTELVTEIDYQTMSSLAVTFAGLLVLYRLCKPMNVFRGILFTVSLAIIVAIICIEELYLFLGYNLLDLQNILFIIVFVQCAYPIYNTFVKFFENKLGKKD
ncbi:MAG: HAD-IC family P-type ATPase [Clostridia bacterium]|nr:HAD-IC family P-type ATPase [Clostridia bacterium]